MGPPWGSPVRLWVPGWGRGGGPPSAGPASGRGTSGREGPHDRGACAAPARGSLSLPGSPRPRPPEARRPLTILQMEAMFRTVISLKVAAIAHRHLYQGKTGLSMVARSEAGRRRGGLGPACSQRGWASEAGRRRGRGGGAGRGVAELRSRGRGRREEEPGAGTRRTGVAATLPPPPPPAQSRSANPRGKPFSLGRPRLPLRAGCTEKPAPGEPSNAAFPPDPEAHRALDTGRSRTGDPHRGDTGALGFRFPSPGSCRSPASLGL